MVLTSLGGPILHFWIYYCLLWTDKINRATCALEPQSTVFLGINRESNIDNVFLRDVSIFEKWWSFSSNPRLKSSYAKLTLTLQTFACSTIYRLNLWHRLSLLVLRSFSLLMNPYMKYNECKLYVPLPNGCIC